MHKKGTRVLGKDGAAACSPPEIQTQTCGWGWTAGATATGKVSQGCLGFQSWATPWKEKTIAYNRAAEAGG